MNYETDAPIIRELLTYMDAAKTDAAGDLGLLEKLIVDGVKLAYIEKELALLCAKYIPYEEPY